MFTAKHLTSSLTNILSIIQAKILESSFTSSFLLHLPLTTSTNIEGFAFETYPEYEHITISMATPLVEPTVLSPWNQLQKLPTGFLLFPCPPSPSSRPHQSSFH